MFINPLKDFDLGDKTLRAGQPIEVNEQDARGLIDIGFAERVDDTKNKRTKTPAAE